MKRNRKYKKVKLDSLPKIRRRLLKLWSEAVRERDAFSCCFCGVKKGDVNQFNPDLKVKIDAHHALQKEIKDCPLKYSIDNGISLCPSHHKFNGETSAHKSPIVFYDWFKKQYPDRYDFILKNSGFRIDLDNRKVLGEIENRLIAKEQLDLNKLQQIEKEFPRENKKTTEDPGNIFDPETKIIINEDHQ